MRSRRWQLFIRINSPPDSPAYCKPAEHCLFIRINNLLEAGTSVGQNRARLKLFIRINIRRSTISQPPGGLVQRHWHKDKLLCAWLLRIRMNSKLRRQAVGHAASLEFMRINSAGVFFTINRYCNRLRRCKNPPHMLAHAGGFSHMDSFSHGNLVSRRYPLFPAWVPEPQRRYPANSRARSQTPDACRQARRSTPRRHRRAACNIRWST